jgi:putative membrane protein
VAFAFIFGGNGRVKSHRFSYVGSSYRQLAQLIFFGKDVARIVESHLVGYGEEEMKGTFFALMLILPMAAFAASNPDGSFYKHAAEGGIAEVDAGRLAQDKGNSQQVKDFGAMMVKDHSAANEKLQALAASKNITLPTTPSVTQMASKAKLDVLSGDAFDKSYVKGQVVAHRQTIALFRKEISSGQDSDAKAFAAATLPTVKAHLKAITAIAADMGIKTK